MKRILSEAIETTATMQPPPHPNAMVGDPDAGHVAVLAVCHFVNAALSFFCAFFTVAPISLLIAAVLYPINTFWPGLAASMPVMLRETLHGIVSLSLISLIFAIPVLNLISGIFMVSYKNWKLSMFTAWLTCLNVPLGTILGIFTIRILSRPDVRAKYAAKASAASPQTI